MGSVRRVLVIALFGLGATAYAAPGGSASSAVAPGRAVSPAPRTAAVIQPLPPQDSNDEVQFFLTSDLARAKPGSPAAKLLLRSPPGGIPGLSWKSVRHELIERTDAHGNPGLYAEARGLIPNDDRSLLIGRSQIRVSPKGAFVALFPITAQAQAFRLYTVDMRGQIQEETIVIEVRGFDVIRKTRLADQNRLHPFTFGLGYSALDYQETGINEVEQPSLTVKGGYQGTLGSQGAWARVTYSLSGYLTALAISSNAPGTTMRFLGVNARLGYAIPHLFGSDSSWSANFGFGYYYTTMFVSVANPSELFGFSNLMGLQLFPSISMAINAKSSVSAYLKFTPISSGISLSNVNQNREIAFGLGYRRRLSPAFDWLLTLDWSNFQYQVDNSLIQSTSLSIGTGIAW